MFLARKGCASSGARTSIASTLRWSRAGAAPGRARRRNRSIHCRWRGGLIEKNRDRIRLGVRKRGQQLFGEQGVALCRLDDPLFVRRGQVHGGVVPDHLRDGVDAKRVEVERVLTIASHAPLGTSFDEFWARQEQEEDKGPISESLQVLEQVEQGRLRPVAVVHDQGQRLDSAEELEGTAEVAEEELRRAPSYRPIRTHRPDGRSARAPSPPGGRQRTPSRTHRRPGRAGHGAGRTSVRCRPQRRSR